MKTASRIGLALAAIGVLSAPAFADSDAAVAALARRIEALQARVTALEAARSFTSYMPIVAERFHVMHRAGEAGDWAVAAHELSELKRLTALAPGIDADKGALMQGMMAPSLAAIDAAVDTADLQMFGQALERTVDTCNACHAATGSDFIQVVLDARDAISLRHPHKFAERVAPAEGEHDHGMPSGMGAAMPHMDGEAAPHGHDAKEAAHTE